MTPTPPSLSLIQFIFHTVHIPLLLKLWPLLFQNVHAGRLFPKFLIRCYGNIVYMCTHTYVWGISSMYLCISYADTGDLFLFISLSSVSAEVLATTNLG